MNIALVENEIDVLAFTNLIEQRAAQGHCGADVIFTGRVRNLNHGKEVVAVIYEAFKPLTEKTFHEICSEAQAEWGQDLSFTVLHRVGRLNVGDVSVLICVSSAHRDEAFEASRYVIEQLKIRAPIWKKEIYSSGETEWLKGHELCQHHGKAHKHAKSLREQKLEL